MRALRKLSERPEILVDPNGNRIGDAIGSYVGRDAPLGRERLCIALPTNKAGKGPIQISPWLALVDPSGLLLGDPVGTVVGEAEAIFVHRLVYATITSSTRRLG